MNKKRTFYSYASPYKKSMYRKKYDTITSGLFFTNFNVAKRATSRPLQRLLLLFYICSNILKIAFNYRTW
ncbi:hypothetical protein C1N61_31220 (plasmid) [Priestia aryabhattai]